MHGADPPVTDDTPIAAIVIIGIAITALVTAGTAAPSDVGTTTVTALLCLFRTIATTTTTTTIIIPIVFAAKMTTIITHATTRMRFIIMTTKGSTATATVS